MARTTRKTTTTAKAPAAAQARPAAAKKTTKAAKTVHAPELVALAEATGAPVVESYALFVGRNMHYLGAVLSGGRGLVPAAHVEPGKRVVVTYFQGPAGLGRPVATGVFRASMEVELVNEGPVTVLLDTRRSF